MNYSIVVLTSVTAAKRAQKVLERNGVLSNIIRTPSKISEYGCSNSLKIKTAVVGDVVKILNKMSFNIREIYNVIQDGVEYKYIKQRM